MVNCGIIGDREPVQQKALAILWNVRLLIGAELKHNRYAITDTTRFQDHRHRPLGHPSAMKSGLNSRDCRPTCASTGHVSPDV
jgi:hypothetical protein